MDDNADRGKGVDGQLSTTSQLVRCSRLFDLRWHRIGTGGSVEPVDEGNPSPAVTLTH